MGFLDNSGDIILDAVLTDAGRQRLARGDGTFKITQFALGDDEINYSMYSGSHPSGSAYYDLDILQTPVLEAFTNNIASLNSKLLTIPRTNLLFLPVIKLKSQLFSSNSLPSLNNTHVILVDANTETDLSSIITSDFSGLIYGFNINNSDPIEVHQGLDTSQISDTFDIDQDLKETQYIVEIDNRLATIIAANSTSTNKIEAAKSFVDDDNIAQYYFSLATDRDFVKDTQDIKDVNTTIPSTIAGPKGTGLIFSLGTSLESQASDYLFTTFGQAVTLAGFACRVIKSNVTITGATTGYSLTIPLSFVKKV
jgi:hypothetical protein